MTNIAAYARTIATAYLGEPNPKFSNGKELRWGTNGSMSLDLDAEYRVMATATQLADSIAVTSLTLANGELFA